MTMMDSLESIASCALEFGFYIETKRLNEGILVIKVKVCSVILIIFCIFVFILDPAIS